MIQQYNLSRNSFYSYVNYYVNYDDAIFLIVYKLENSLKD